MDKPLLKSNYLRGFLQNRILIVLPVILVALGLLLSGDALAHEEISPENTKDILSFIYSETEHNDTEIFPPKVVTIRTMNGERTIIVYADTVEELLITGELELDFNDLVLPGLTATIIPNGIIKVIEVDVEFTFEEESLAFEYLKQESEAYTTGQFILSQVGEEGLAMNTIRTISQDGVVIKAEIVETEIIKEPINQITLIGTKPVTIASCEYWHEVVDNVVPASNTTKREWFKYTMWRETGCDSGKASHGTGFFKGLMQFSPRTFTAKGGENIWDGYEQILMASEMYDHAGVNWDYIKSQWPTATKEFLSGARY